MYKLLQFITLVDIIKIIISPSWLAILLCCYINQSNLTNMFWGTIFISSYQKGLLQKAVLLKTCPFRDLVTINARLFIYCQVTFWLKTKAMQEVACKKNWLPPWCFGWFCFLSFGFEYHQAGLKTVSSECFVQPLKAQEVPLWHIWNAGQDPGGNLFLT